MTITSLISIIVSAALYFSAYHLNEWLFKAFEIHSSANWIFLPAGLRLICTLLLGINGAVGLLIGALLANYSTSLLDIITSVGDSFIGAGAPLLAYLLALHTGMPKSLHRLSATRLSVLALMYALISSLLYSLWYVARDVYPNFLHNWVTMFIGDLLGTLIIIYTLKILLALYRLKHRRSF
jgi:hypothetical protein